MEQHREKIEHYGVVLEGMGLTPVAARVFVYLSLCPAHSATFDDMVGYFKVSKSAVSNALKMLATTGMVEAKTKGGQRKRYFYVSLQQVFSEERAMGKFKAFYTMLEDLRAIRNIDDEFDTELANTAKFYQMMLAEFPIIIERWKRMIALDKEKNQK